MNRFTVMLGALALAFVSGWLFANEIAPPTLDNANLAMWMLTGETTPVLAALVSARG